MVGGNKMEITDKELLAICNLSNLKMEFANLIEKEETKKKQQIKWRCIWE